MRNQELISMLIIVILTLLVIGLTIYFFSRHNKTNWGFWIVALCVIIIIVYLSDPLSRDIFIELSSEIVYI